MNGAKDLSEKLMDFLALNRYAEGLRSLQVPKDALSWTRFCGSLSLVLVVLLFLSGAFMMFYYSPLPAQPMTVWTLLSFSVPFGDVIRGVHFYAWNTLLIVLGFTSQGLFSQGPIKHPGKWFGSRGS